MYGLPVFCNWYCTVYNTILCTTVQSRYYRAQPTYTFFISSCMVIQLQALHLLIYFLFVLITCTFYLYLLFVVLSVFKYQYFTRASVTNKSEGWVFVSGPNRTQIVFYCRHYICVNKMCESFPRIFELGEFGWKANQEVDNKLVNFNLFQMFVVLISKWGLYFG